VEQEQELARLREQSEQLKAMAQIVRGWYEIGGTLSDIEVLNIAIADLVRYESQVCNLAMALKGIIDEDADRGERRKRTIAAALRRMDNEKDNA